MLLFITLLTESYIFFVIKQLWQLNVNLTSLNLLHHWLSIIEVLQWAAGVFLLALADSIQYVAQPVFSPLIWLNVVNVVDL